MGCLLRERASYNLAGVLGSGIWGLGGGRRQGHESAYCLKPHCLVSRPGTVGVAMQRAGFSRFTIQLFWLRLP